MDGNIRVCYRPIDAGAPDLGDLWLIATDVPTPPPTVAAGFRQLVRTWGVHDPVLTNVSVLSDGGGVPPFVTDCACCFEQLFQALVSPNMPNLPKMDFIIRSVWTICRGQHTAALRPAVEAASAPSHQAARVGRRPDPRVGALGFGRKFAAGQHYFGASSYTKV